MAVTSRAQLFKKARSSPQVLSALATPPGPPLPASLFEALAASRSKLAHMGIQVTARTHTRRARLLLVDAFLQ